MQSNGYLNSTKITILTNLLNIPVLTSKEKLRKHLEELKEMYEFRIYRNTELIIDYH